MTTKKCIQCNEVKQITKFDNHPTARDGKRNQCTSCRYKSRIKKEGIDTYRVKQKRWNLMRYGITLEFYESEIVAQNNSCKICNREFGDTRSTNPHVDHDHITKAYRGLLCTQCNTALGLLGDDPNRLEAAAQYLRQQQPSTS